MKARRESLSAATQADGKSWRLRQDSSGTIRATRFHRSTDADGMQAQNQPPVRSASPSVRKQAYRKCWASLRDKVSWSQWSSPSVSGWTNRSHRCWEFRQEAHAGHSYGQDRAASHGESWLRRAAARFRLRWDRHGGCRAGKAESRVPAQAVWSVATMCSV